MKRNTVKIGKFNIGGGQPIFIIAEAGVNHNGDIKLAKKMIDAAKECGANAIKFQTFIAEEVMTGYAPKAKYQIKNTGKSQSQIEMAKKFELPLPAFKVLMRYAKSKRIIFLSTPFDPASAEYLNKLGITAFKISSGDITNIPFLAQIARYGKPIILSTGMATIEEIKDAIEAIYLQNNQNIILLHCTSNYPVNINDINLRAMDTIKKKFGIPVGYSDHSFGIEVSIAATALGASIIEKHFTLSRNFSGPDHVASLEPNELKLLVTSVRNIEKAMGSAVKAPVKSEMDTKKVARKSIVAAVHIPKGVRIKEEMLAIKRPGNGISPKKIKGIIGKIAKRNIKKDSLLIQKRDLI